MGKILSVLEKYKLIEKEPENMSTSEPLTETSSDAVSFTTAKELEEPAKEMDSVTAANVSSNSSHTIAYDKKMSLEEIYTAYGLNEAPVTDTVFVLENLMNALPAELPEYVKKTTLNNILLASSMNLERLLTDGTSRYHQLSKFSNDYTAQNTKDITALKQEIDKLSAIISDYHQQIKQKELMVNEQISLVKQEEERLQGILSFFDK